MIEIEETGMGCCGLKKAPGAVRNFIGTRLDLLWWLMPLTFSLLSCTLYSRPTVRVFSPEGAPPLSGAQICGSKCEDSYLYVYCEDRRSLHSPPSNTTVAESRTVQNLTCGCIVRRAGYSVLPHRRLISSRIKCMLNLRAVFDHPF